eukprot:TRINITY_DN10169_c0_g1_i1.p1 TRINITY_DN10169_c0_g1~~TRINITY_DN10169_c0_g1_i1.p1  ORF type:complete len:196 (+),score=33.73 TRINITY_DN10169_c0_g1_i1:49-636(+)
MSWNPNNFDGGPRPEPPRQPQTAEQQMDEAFLASIQGFLSNSRVGKPPASKLAVQEMDLIIFDERLLKKYPDPCTICTEKFKLEDEAKQFPCKHLFHEDCIIQWLEKNNSCPLCRHELPTLDLSYEEQKRLEAARKAKEQRSTGGGQQPQRQQRAPNLMAMMMGHDMSDEEEDDEYDRYASDRNKSSSSHSSMYS